MTDPQLTNNNNRSNSSSNSNSISSISISTSNNNIINNNNSSTNNNNTNSNITNLNNHNSNNYDEEPKYLHKKFKKMATSEITSAIINTSASHGTIHEEMNNLVSVDSTNTGESAESRRSGYVCPYCKLSCAKPSVLQKHIRAHTNERPYPCVPCGFAFKTKSNLYKHCRSRAHALKMESSDVTKVLQTALQLSDDSDASFSDNASNGATSPTPLLPSLPPPLPTASFLSHLSEVVNTSSSQNTTKIYKPKFHTALQHCTLVEGTAKTKVEFLQEHIQYIITDNNTIVEAFDIQLQKYVHCSTSSPETESSRKRCQEFDVKNSIHSETTSDLEPDLKCEFNPEFESDYFINSQPLPSPGPLLGHTQLVDVRKRPRLEELSHYPHSSTLHMFGGEVRILDRSGESKTVRIKARPNGSSDTSVIDRNLIFTSETTSVVVRSSLHSGGTMLQKPVIETVLPELHSCDRVGLTALTPNISPPSLAPCLDVLRVSETHSPLFSSRITESADKIILITAGAPPFGNKFLRPSSLPLKPGSFTPKRHHGITPTLNTLPLVSPETPRPKKSYGQLYLNGHAYTYLGLKCSTRLFYCTLNRPQPMYVTQQNGLSMYSNWKICNEAPPELEFAQYDSRQRPTGYTLANYRHEDILTHSSQRPRTPSSPDSGLESDSQERARKLQLFEDGFESNENYTYLHDRGKLELGQEVLNRAIMDASSVLITGHYRNVCKECGIHCKKLSMLKKHMCTYTNVQPYQCDQCSFSFKTKDKLTKHMKSKTHHKKCIEFQMLRDGQIVTAQDQGSSDADSTSEGDTELEHEAENEKSGGEDREIVRGLLSLAKPVTPRLPGLLSIDRPATYPYGYTLLRGSEEPAAPIDLTTRQPDEPITELASLVSVAERASLIAELPEQGAGSSAPQISLGPEVVPRRVVVGGPDFRMTVPSVSGGPNFASITEDARNVCGICSKVFSKSSQLRLHINIHYFERPFRCESCGTSFRTKGHLTKHERSTLHHNKVSMTSTFGAATASNPRPFKCTDCKSAFRIHGHLAKHLRSKMHIMKLECLRKLPFGTYAEMERSGVNLNDIDTNDCDTSLTSLRIMAQKLFEKDLNKLEQWEIGMLPNHVTNGGDSSSDEEQINSVHSTTQCTEAHLSQNYYMTMRTESNDVNLANIKLDSLKNNPMYKCHLCSVSLRNLSELHIHCFVEHNIKLSNSSIIHSSTNFEDEIKNKNNSHNLKKMGMCTVRQVEAGQRIDAT